MTFFESASSFVESIFGSSTSADSPLATQMEIVSTASVEPAITTDAGSGSSSHSASDAFGTAASFCQCAAESSSVTPSFQSTTDTWGSIGSSSSDFGSSW